MGRREASGWPETSQRDSSMLQGVSGDPLLGLTRHAHKRLKVIETE
jgi:hypothetical protein